MEALTLSGQGRGLRPLAMALAHVGAQAKNDLLTKEKYDYKSSQSVIMFFLVALTYKLYSWIYLLRPTCFLKPRIAGGHLLDSVW